MEKALSIFLKLSATIQIVYWSLSHLFFPTWYLSSVGMHDLAAHPEPVLIFMHEIGVLTLGIGIATWLASRNPVRNFHIILMLYIVSLGSVCTSFYHIIVGKSGSGEWSTIVIILVQLAILSILYPWKKLRNE